MVFLKLNATLLLRLIYHITMKKTATKRCHFRAVRNINIHAIYVTMTQVLTTTAAVAKHHHHHHHHHHKHQGLDPLIRSVSTVTAAHTNASSVFQ